MPDKRGTQCCAFGCSKRKRKVENNACQIRSASEGSSDEESVRKRQSKL